MTSGGVSGGKMPWAAATWAQATTSWAQATAVLGPMDSSRFKKLQLLCSGTFSEAWVAMSTISQRKYVVKELKMTEVTIKEREAMFNEVDIIRKCCHVNIIRYKDCFIHQPNPIQLPVLCIVMEYADCGDLHHCIMRHRETKKLFSESRIRNWFVQMTFALQYLHKNNILHRNLKPQNIFMASTNLLKLGDFGISKTLSHENDYATTAVGTPQYLSPEVCRQKPYNYKSDIWGLGCVLYEMCALQPAFPDSDWPTLVHNIVGGRYKPLPGQYSGDLSALVKVMLRPDPTKRPSAEQLLGAKVLEKDVNDYMNHIRNLPNVQENGRKGSTSSSSCSSSSSVGSIATSATCYMDDILSTLNVPESEKKGDGSSDSADEESYMSAMSSPTPLIA